MDETTAPRRTCRSILACALLCAVCLPVSAEEKSPASGDAVVDLGALTFPVEGVRQVTQIVARVTANFANEQEAEPHRAPEGIIRLRDAALGAVRDTSAAEAAAPIDVAAIERRLQRAIAWRAPGLEGIRFDVLGVRTDDRR